MSRPTDSKSVTALIVGASGQDGRLLQERLAKQGTRVIGLSRSGLSDGPVVIPGVSLARPENLQWIIDNYRPDEVYYLAGYHTSSELRDKLNPAEEYRQTQEVHVLGLVYCLEAIRLSGMQTRLFYAASSLIFKGGRNVLIDESTPISPQGFYGLSKVDGLFVCDEYRRRHGVSSIGGILFNHESRLRPRTFVSQKVAQAAARIKLNLQDSLVLGTLDAMIDWGHAEDFVSGFVDVLRSETMGDYIFATGEGHTIRDLVGTAFECVGLDWTKYINVVERGVAQSDACRIGNPAKLIRATGWKRKWTFEAMVQDLVAHQLEIARS